ncbi:SH3 domain-containing protein [Proteiniclasticum sp.]|uniref:SH3 domain-containing protein n=1 Tax=Proteiniclasticum sp. TaxID=2053595 RepID=UPI00289E5E6B|nr:SH3 domain-containing protein [Proteiniclasticum sp.]
MISRKLKILVAKITLLSMIAAGTSAILPLHSDLKWADNAMTVMAAETGKVTVTCSSLWTYSRAAWAAKIAVVSKGTSFNVVDKLVVDGREMYRLDNGRYITANPAYVSFQGSAAVAAPAPAPTPAPAPQAGSEMATTANLYMRTGPDSGYKSIRIIPNGSRVTALESQNGWYKVSFSGSTGWSSGKYLKAAAVSVPAPPVSAAATYVRTNANLNLRKGIGTSFGILSTIPSGTPFKVLAASGGWYQVSYNGQIGWASGSYMTKISSYSEKVISIPYVNQYAPVYAPMGCEGASLLMALQFKGSTSEGLKSFLEKMPMTERNPYTGFASTPFAVVQGTPEIFQSIFPEALTAYGRNYSANVTDISGSTTEQLKAEIDKGNPVVVYVTTRNYETPKWKVYDMGEAGMVNIVDNMHVMVLTGYNSDGSYHVTDPASSRKTYWVTREKFEASYNALKWAVVVK